MEHNTFFTANVLQIKNKIFLPFYKDFTIHERINIKSNFRATGIWIKKDQPLERLTKIELENQCYNKFKNNENR